MPMNLANDTKVPEMHAVFPSQTSLSYHIFIMCCCVFSVTSYKYCVFGKDE